MSYHFANANLATGTAAMPHPGEFWESGIRELTLPEATLFQRHLLRLQGDCRRARFGNPASDAFLTSYVGRLDAANACVLGCFIDREMRGAVELRSLRSEWCSEAEVAFSVEKDWRARGIGTALMARVVEVARTLGIAHLYLSCHPFNRPMQRIAERFAAKMAFEDGECFADIALHWQSVAPILDHAPGSDRILALGL